MPTTSQNFPRIKPIAGETEEMYEWRQKKMDAVNRDWNQKHMADPKKAERERKTRFLDEVEEEVWEGDGEGIDKDFRDELDKNEGRAIRENSKSAFGIKNYFDNILYSENIKWEKKVIQIQEELRRIDGCAEFHHQGQMARDHIRMRMPGLKKELPDLKNQLANLKKQPWMTQPFFEKPGVVLPEPESLANFLRSRQERH